MSTNRKTIAVSPEFHKEIYLSKKPSESFESFLRRKVEIDGE